jgi:hypothetical protein
MICDVALKKSKAGVMFEHLDTSLRTSREIIDGNDVPSSAQKSLT